MNNIKILRTTFGEDIIADIEGETEKKYSIKNPVRIVVIPNRTDPKTPQIGLSPFAEFSEDKTFSVDKSHIFCIMTPVKEFINQYNSIFSSIIMNPKGPGLIIPGT